MVGRNETSLGTSATPSTPANVGRADGLVEELFQTILQNSDRATAIGPQLGVVVPNVISPDHAAVMGLEMVNDYLAAQDGLPYNSQQQNQTRPPLQCPQCQTFITPMWFPLNGSHLCTSCAHSVLWSVVEPSISTLFQRYLTVSDENDDLPNPTVTESAGSSHQAAPALTTDAQFHSGSPQTQSGQQSIVSSLLRATNATSSYQQQLTAALRAVSTFGNAATANNSSLSSTIATFHQLINQLRSSSDASSANNTNNGRTSANGTADSTSFAAGHSVNHQQQQIATHTSAEINTTTNIQPLVNRVASTEMAEIQSTKTASNVDSSEMQRQ